MAVHNQSPLESLKNGQVDEKVITDIIRQRRRRFNGFFPFPEKKYTFCSEKPETTERGKLHKMCW
jgi:hypothetical protein